MIDLKLKANNNEARVFAVSQLLVAGLVAWWLHGKGHDNAAMWIFGASAAIAIVGLIAPKAVSWLYAGWMLAAFPIGFVMSYVTSGLVYFLVITPIGLMMRAVGRDPMTRKFDPEATSYWAKSEPTADPKRYFRQF